MPTPVLPPVDDTPRTEPGSAGPHPSVVITGLTADEHASLVAGSWPVPGVGSDYSWGCAYVPSTVNHFRAAGLYEEDHASRGAPASANPGDLIIMDGEGHIGMVDFVADDGSIIRWDGNWADSIGQRRSSRSIVDGICHVPYPSPAHAQAALDWFRARDGLGEDPPGSNCNEVTAACGLGCVAWCDEAASLAVDEGFGANPSPPPAPGPASANPFCPLDVDGEFGPQSTRATQYAIGTDADGSFGPISRRALQAHLGVDQDGDIGPITTKALQARVGADQDGEWGPLTTQALQQALNEARF